MLHVDTELVPVEPILPDFEHHCADFEILTAQTATEGLDRLDEADIDCVVSDYDLPDMNGLDFLEAVRERQPDLPLILFTDSGSEEIASTAITAGVTDYFTKPNPDDQIDGPGQYAVLADRIADVVSQLRTECTLQTENERLRKLYSGITDAIFTLDSNWCFTHLNSQAEDLLQRSEAELVGENVWEQFSAAVDTPFQHEYERAMREQESVEFEEYYLPLDTWFSVRAVPTDDGLTVHFRDITEKKEREERLEVRMTAMETSVDGIAIVDADGEYTYVNQAHADIYGYDDPAMFLGEHWQMCYADEGLAYLEETVMPVLREESEWRGEVTGKRQDGTTFPQELSLSTLASGGIVCVVRDITEWKERERAIERNKSLLKKTQSLTTVGGWELDLGTEELRWTDEVYRIHELPLDYEPTLERGLEFYHPDDRSLIETAVERAIEHGESFDVELRLMTAHDDLRWVRAQGEPHQENGETVILRGAFQDITERKERQRQFEAIFNQTFQFTGLMKPDGTLIEANETAQKFGGVDREDVVGGYIWESYWWEDRPEGQARVREAVERAADGEFVRYEQEVNGADDSAIIDFSIKPVADEQDEVVLLIPEGRDITERVNYEQALSTLHDATRQLMVAPTQQEVAEITSETAREILDLPINGIHLYDPTEDGLVPAAVSPAYQELCGDPPIVEAGDGVAWKVFETGESRIVEDVRESADVSDPAPGIRSGLYVPLGEYGVLLVESATVDAFDDVDVSLTKLLAAHVEAALERADREQTLRMRESSLKRQNEQLEQFAKVLAHDLRNPLNVAQGNVSITKQNYQSKYLDRATEALDRIEELIHDMLTLAQVGQDIDETTAVSLEHVAAEAARMAGTTLEDIIVPADLGTIEADRERLRTLFENLFRNAAQHAGPETTVRVGRLDGDTEHGFYVADDGPGIPLESREAVFDDGYTTNDDGTGFGLSIVSTIAEAHGWSVVVTDSADGGARFEIRGTDTPDVVDSPMVSAE